MAQVSFSKASISETVDAGAGSTALLAANANALYRKVTNLSDEDVAIGLGVAAVATKGIVLKALAATFPPAFVEYPTPGNVMFNGVINGISASGGKACAVVEA